MNAPSAIPDLERWAVWGPLGVLFIVGVYVFIDWYISVQKPRLKQREHNEKEAHDGHMSFLKTTSETTRSLAESHKTVADCIQRYDGHFDTLRGEMKQGFRSILENRGRCDDPNHKKDDDHEDRN